MGRQKSTLKIYMLYLLSFSLLATRDSHRSLVHGRESPCDQVKRRGAQMPSCQIRKGCIESHLLPFLAVRGRRAARRCRDVQHLAASATKTCASPPYRAGAYTSGGFAHTKPECSRGLTTRLDTNAALLKSQSMRKTHGAPGTTHVIQGHSRRLAVSTMHPMASKQLHGPLGVHRAPVEAMVTVCPHSTLI